MSTQQIQLLEKLAQIHSWKAACCNTIREIALRNPIEFAKKAGQIENWLKNSQPDKPEEAARQALDDDCYAIYEIMVHSDPIRELVLADPRLSQVDVEELIDYASIADVSPDPDPEIMLRSKDALFMRLLDRILRQFPTTPEDVFRDNLAALIAIQKEYPDLLQELYRLAEHFDWTEHLRNIQRYIDADNNAKPKTGRWPEAAEAILKKIEEQEQSAVQAKHGLAVSESVPPSPPSIPTYQATVRDFLFGELQITTMQREEVLLFQQIEDKLGEIENNIQQPTWVEFSAKQKGDAIARALLEQGVISAESSKPIQERTARRMEAAQHYVELREFVKFNALNHTWPELSAELINNRADFLAFESRMLDLETVVDEAKGSGEVSRLLQRYLTDDQLLRFLNLRPYFSGLNVEQAEQIYKLTSSLPQTDMGTPQPKTPPEQAPVGQAPSGETVIGPVAAISSDVFENLNISITWKSTALPEEQSIQCKIRAEMLSTTEWAEEARVIQKQDIDVIKNNAYNLMRLQYNDRETRSLGVNPPAKRAPASYKPKQKLLSSQLKDLGVQLGSLFFTDTITTFIVKALHAYPKVRFALDIQVHEFWSLPWECLYISALKLPVALVSKHSLVRYFPKPNRIPPQPWGGKIRILVLFSGPMDVVQLKLEEEEKVLHEVFANVSSVEIHTIPHVTLDEFLSQMRTFNPHIVQFSGHGGLDPATEEGALLFETPDGKADWVHASQFSILCRDQNVSLVVLNACDTGTAVANDAVTSVAGALIDAGIPATIATTRAIYDIQSIMFVREFYRALVDGYPIESAMAEARKRVNSENLDWSAFALFVSAVDLDRYRLTLERK